MNTYMPNNLRYRCSVAKTLEGFYNTKAFLLNQLCDESLRFSNTAKEILLVCLDKHNDWLGYVEYVLLGSENTTKDEIDSIKLALLRQARLTVRIFRENQHIFDSIFIEHWEKINQQNLDAFIDSVDECLDVQQLIAFPAIAEELMQYLNAILFEIYELDCMLGSNFVKNRLSKNNSSPETLLLYIDDGVLHLAASRNRNPSIERLQYYIKNLINENSSFSVEIRDYSKQGCFVALREEQITQIRKFLAELPQVIDVVISKRESAQ